MQQPYDRDRDHLNILGIIYYVNAGTIAFVSLFGLLYAGFGVLMLTGTLPGPEAGNGGQEAQIIGTMLAVIGFGATALGLALALLSYLAGRWLRAGQHPTFCFVVAIINLLNMPYGTLLGIFTIIVLGRPRVKAIFSGDPEAETEADATLAASHPESRP